MVEMMRPRQWLKNLMIFFPPLLSGAIFHPGMIARGLLPFSIFCCASSAAYIFNDLLDQGRDECHPDKRNRPLPSGRIARLPAFLLGNVLLVLAVIAGGHLPFAFFVMVSIYLLVSVCYSICLKHFPIVDVFSISLGFVLRLYGGGAAFNISISEWLFLTVFLLSVFLSVGKRYSERRFLGITAGNHRGTLEVYPDGFLEGAMYLSGATVLVTYSMYAISTPFLVYTVPLCMFGLLRYLLRVQSGGNGDPTEALLKDAPLFITGILWLIMVGWSVYR